MEEQKEESRRDSLWVVLVLVAMVFVMSSPELWWNNVRIGLRGLAGLLP
jgi:hypothetical protein